MIELGSVFTCDNRSSKPLFKIFSGISGNGAAGLSYALVFFKADRLFLLRELPCGDLSKLVKSWLLQGEGDEKS